jgi:hypothetical protein
MTVCQTSTRNRCVKSGQKVFLRIKTLVFRVILATFGIGSLVTGLAEAAYGANLTLLSPSESGLSVLSNEPAIGIENRSYSKDYANILSEVQPQTEWQPIFLNHQTAVPVIQIPAPLLNLIKTVELSTGGSSLDSDQLVNVRYRMDLN